MEIHAHYYSASATGVSLSIYEDSDKMFGLIRENRIKDILTLFQSTPRDRLASLVNERNHKYDKMLPINYCIKCSANHLILIMLLRLGARFDDSTESPLFLAVRSGLMNLVKILLISGVDVNVFDSNGYTILHWACFRKNVLMVRLLLKVTDFNLHNHDRNTNRVVPLGIAIESKCYEMVKELLKCPQVDPNIIDSLSHRYLYDLAAESGQHHTCLELETAFKRSNSANLTSKRAMKRNFHDLHEYRVEAVIQHQLRSQWLKFTNDPRGAYEPFDDSTLRLPLLPNQNDWKVISEDSSLDSLEGWKYSYSCDENGCPLVVTYSGDSVCQGGSLFYYIDNYRCRLLARIQKVNK